ncbi:hypothetical protein [Gracilibacillus salinarum]|uniref:Phage holin family protein n=1 Tax=Gracilibacillus salinarum TaxID=2932255 RepID=A0ABY4GHB5_9BACI|nr:hypothetical protein [Gracilibacillus salinarum]UOQ83626.1 hypothetical protein MUN87_12760 [Gracilibacillus salinarum]
MFSFRGFIQTIGVSLLIIIAYTFIIGFFNVLSVEWVIFTTFIVSYGSVGILAPLWNKQTPYSAAFLSAIVMSVINIMFSMIVLQIPVLIEPNTINENLFSSTVFSLVTAFLFLQINKRIGREKDD